MVDSRMQWFPVVPSAVLAAGRTLFAACVQDQELVLWRAADGTVQVWENRCPHRSVRLTMGQVLGDRLSCAYHGWQFQAGTGACVAIPAHPQMVAPRDVRVHTWLACEHRGMVWARDGAASESGSPPAPSGGDVLDTGFFCRTLPLRTSLRSVRVFLDDAGWQHDGLLWRGTVADLSCELLLLDARAELTFAHVWLAGPVELHLNKALHAGLRQLREQIEVIRHA